MHLIRFHMGQLFPQNTLTLAGLVRLTSGDIDEDLVFFSYCESYRHQLGDLQEPICCSWRKLFMDRSYKGAAGVASHLSPARCVTGEWVRPVLFFIGANLTHHASHIIHLGAAQHIKYHQANSTNTTLFAPSMLILIHQFMKRTPSILAIFFKLPESTTPWQKSNILGKVNTF